MAKFSKFKKGRISKDVEDYMSKLDSDNGFPKDTLKRIAFIETRLGANRNTSSAGAQGLFQFMPGTAKRFGVNVHDDYSSAEGAAKYLKWLNNRYNGDWNKTVAAYNWGEGNVDKKYNNPKKIPTETKNYINMFNGNNKDIQKEFSSDTFSNAPNTMTAASTGSFNPNNSQNNASWTQESAQQDPDYAAYQQYLQSLNNKPEDEVKTPDQVFEGLPQTTDEDVESMINSLASNPPQVQGNIVTPQAQNQGLVTPASNNANIVTPQAQSNWTQESAQQDPDYAAYQQYIKSQNNIQQPQQPTNNVLNIDDTLQIPTSNLQPTNEPMPDISGNNPTSGNGMTADQQYYLDTSTKPTLEEYMAQPKIQTIMNAWNKIPENKQAEIFNNFSPEEQNFIKMYYNIKGQEPSDKSYLRRSLEGAAEVGNKGATMTAQGIAYLTGNDKNLGNLQKSARSDKFQSELKDLSENQGGARTVGRIAGEVLPTMTGAGLAKTALGKVGERALSGGLYSAITNPTTSTPEDFVSDVGKTAALGAVLNPIAGAAGDKAGKALTNRFFKDELSNENKKFLSEANKIGVKPLASDLPGTTDKAKDIVSAYAGSNKKIRSQISENLKAIDKETRGLRDNYNQFDKNTYLGDNTPIGKAAKNKSKIGIEAKEFKNKADLADNTNIDQRLKITLGSQMLNKKIKADELYKKATKGLNEDFKMDMPQVKSVINDMLSTKNKSTLEERKAFRDMVKNFTGDDKEIVNDFSKFPLNNYEDVRKSINSNIRELLDSEKATSPKLVNSLTKLKNALDNDVFDNAIKNAGKDINKIKDIETARKYYRDNIAEIENDKDISKFFDYNRLGTAKEDLPTILKSPILTEKVLKYSDEASKDALRVGALNHIISSSTRNGALDDISPRLLNNAISKYNPKSGGKSSIDILFNGNANEKIKALQTVSKNLKSFDSYNNSNPKNGYAIYKKIAEFTNKAILTAGVGASAVSANILPVLTAGGLAGAIKLHERGLAKVLSDPAKYKKLVELAEADPRKLSYIRKAGDFLGMLATLEANKAVNE